MNKLHFNIYIKIEKKLFYFKILLFYCIFDQINAALVSTRDSLQQHNNDPERLNDIVNATVKG